MAVTTMDFMGTLYPQSQMVGRWVIGLRAAAGEFVLGLDELLADVGGSATSRQIVTRLAATASTGRYRRLRTGLAALDQRWRGQRLPGAKSLGVLLGRHAGEVVEGIVIEQDRRTRQGIAWRARRPRQGAISSG